MSVPTKKVLILPLCLSLALHLAILFATGRADLRAREDAKNVLTVDLKKAVEKPRSRQERKKGGTPRVRAQARYLAGSPPPGEVYDADTVDLGDTDSPYTPYLKHLRRQIERTWVYPEGAYTKKEEGVAVVRFSVAKNGRLEEIDLMTSSGSSLLDEGTIQAIRAAAPYEPLPATFNISRLNIVAAFRYRLAP